MAHSLGEHVFACKTVPNGMRAAVLIDGRVGGSWKVVHQGKVARLRVALYRRVSVADNKALRAEGARLLAMMAATAEDHDVHLEPAQPEPAEISVAAVAGG